jgi:ribose transport system ATP-binding protein
MSDEPVGLGSIATGVMATNLSKSFQGNIVLQHASIDLHAGEVHALLGTNGSGKSTLIKVLAGYHMPDDPDSSSIVVNGQPISLGSVQNAHAAGLRFIHQDLGLIDSLTVEENFRLPTSAGFRWLSTRREQNDVASILRRYGVHVDPQAACGTLSPIERALLAIVRAVEDGLGRGGLLVLDEPTAALPQDEVHQLFAIIEQLKSNAVAILYVTHRLPEVFEIADRVTVLRDGRVTARESVASLTPDTLVELLLGYRLAASDRASVQHRGPTLLTVKGLRGRNVEGFDLDARSGEVVGITGLLGSGFQEVLSLIFDKDRVRSGHVQFQGRDISNLSPRERIRIGIAYSPADRHRCGAVLSWSLRENVTLPMPPYHGPLRWMTRSTEGRDAAVWLAKMNVTKNVESRFSSLSGGNQQRAIISRWLRVHAKVLLMEEPTNGVDASAKAAIRAALRDAAREGATVIVSSSDTEELVRLCDRVIVMRDGAIRREIGGSAVTERDVNAAIVGM